jgi:hypothetical protein
VLCLSRQLALPPAALAQPQPIDEMLRGPHTEESSVILGAKGVLAGEREARASRLAGGAGIFAETSLWRDRLELELGLVLTTPGVELAVAVEPLLKLPLHMAERVDSYVALGPTLLSATSARQVRAGGQLVLGSYIWFGAHHGLDLDLGLAAFGGDGALFELSVGLGPVARF